MNIQQIKLSQVAVNENNPRKISDDKLEALIDSVLVLPKMMSLRPVVVDATNMALGGNMRLTAMQHIAQMTLGDVCARLNELKGYESKTDGEKKALTSYWEGWLKEPTCFVVVADELSEDEQKEFIIKDNLSFGSWDWDIISNDWDSDALEEWGMSVPDMSGNLNTDDFFSEGEEKAGSGEKITVTIPEDIAEAKEEIQRSIEEIIKPYEGVKVK